MTIISARYTALHFGLALSRIAAVSYGNGHTLTPETPFDVVIRKNRERKIAYGTRKDSTYQPGSKTFRRLLPSAASLSPSTVISGDLSEGKELGSRSGSQLRIVWTGKES